MLEIQQSYAERMNATVLSLKSSHASLISNPEELADLIVNATKVSDSRQQTAPENEVDNSTK